MGNFVFGLALGFLCTAIGYHFAMLNGCTPLFGIAAYLAAAALITTAAWEIAG